MELDLIITTCDRHVGLQILIDSISHTDLHFKNIIIVDNGFEKVNSSCIKCNSNLIYLPVRARIGSQMSRNIGFSFSTSPWIMFFDDDDEFFPGNHTHCFECINDDIKIIFSESIVMKGNQLIESRTLPINFNFANIINRNPFTFSGTIINAELFKKVGSMQNDLKSLQDWDLWIRILSATNINNLLFNRNCLTIINIDSDKRISNNNFKNSFLFLIKRNIKFIFTSGAIILFFHKIAWRLLIKRN